MTHRYVALDAEPSASAAWSLAHERCAAEDAQRSAWLDEQMRREPEKRLPPTPTGPCACGCGTVIELRDPWGRPRRYANGHIANTRKKDRLCSVPGCKGKHDSHGYCARHRAEWRRGSYYKPPITNSGSVAGE